MCADTYEIPMHKAKPSRKFDITSNEIVDALCPVDSAVSFASVNQEMYAGGSISAPSNFAFTSELKMARERVLAGLRKVDTGEVTASEMQSILFQMGIEPPELLLTMLQRKSSNGTLDWKKVVRLLDDEVFKPLALQVREVADYELEPLKEKFIESLKARGSTSLSDLAGAYRSVSRSGEVPRRLSFAEFKQSYRSLRLNKLSDDELRRLMVSFDKSGDGQIDAEEFLAFLRGPLSQRRNKLVNWAFRSFDKQGTSEFPVETLISSYDASYHPAVISGATTERKAMASVLGSFGVKKDISSTISRDEFFDFIGNLSVFIEDDDTFETMMKGSFKLGEKEPAPPEFQSSFGFEKSAFSGKQHHGDILSWSQEPSALEKSSPQKTVRLSKDFSTSSDLRHEIERPFQTSYKNSR